MTVNDSDKTSRETDGQEQTARQAEESDRQIANMDYSDFVSLLMESRII